VSQRPAMQPWDGLDREDIHLCATVLEVRAAKNTRVEISDRFARQVARYLRQLIEGA